MNNAEIVQMNCRGSMWRGIAEKVEAKTMNHTKGDIEIGNSARNFRGKSTETNQWVYGNYCYQEHICRTQLGITHEIIGVENGQYGEIRLAVIPETVGQSIGRKDGHDKEAFQGDMVEALGHKGWEVAWCDCGWKLRRDDILTRHNIPRDFIIIGNKWDNPKLHK